MRDRRPRPPRSSPLARSLRRCDLSRASTSHGSACSLSPPLSSGARPDARGRPCRAPVKAASVGKVVYIERPREGGLTGKAHVKPVGGRAGAPLGPIETPRLHLCDREGIASKRLETCSLGAWTPKRSSLEAIAACTRARPRAAAAAAHCGVSGMSSRSRRNPRERPRSDSVPVDLSRRGSAALLPQSGAAASSLARLLEPLETATGLSCMGSRLVHGDCRADDRARCRPQTPIMRATVCARYTARVLELGHAWSAPRTDARAIATGSRVCRRRG